MSTILVTTTTKFVRVKIGDDPISRFNKEVETAVRHDGMGNINIISNLIPLLTFRLTDSISIDGVVQDPDMDPEDLCDAIQELFPDANSGSGGTGLTAVSHGNTLTGDGGTTPLDVAVPVTGNEINLWNDAAALSAGGTNRIVSGNAVWRTGLVFDIIGTVYNTLVYYILGTRYEITATSVTLSTADATNDRIDVIYFDTSGLVGVITGTPAVDPVKPIVDSDTQVELTHISVPANATQPVISGNLKVYDENIEFTGASTNGTVNFANTTAPSVGTKHISCGAFTNNQNINLSDGSLHDSSLYQNLSFKLRLNATFATNTYLGFYFANGTSPVSNQVIVQNNTFGYVRTVTGSYQVVSIPISAFVFTNTQFNRLYIVFHGSNGTGFYLDAITLQGGITTPALNGVQSYNNRTGNIIPQTGDYNISQITNGLSNSLTNARMFIGNGSNVATGVALSGDASIDNTGALIMTGIRTKSIPSLSAGILRYSGAAFSFAPEIMENALNFSGIDNTGATDSTAAINAMIAGSSNNIFFFPAGTYKVTTSELKVNSQTNKRGIELRSGITIIGEGFGKTIFTTGNNTTGNTTDTHWYPVFNGHSTSVSDVTIHDLEITGNRANQAIYNANPYSNPTGHSDLTTHQSIQGIFFYQGDNNKVYNVYAHLCQGFGIEFYQSTNFHTHNCKYSQNGNGGVASSGTGSGTLPTGKINNCLITDNNSDNIRIVGSGAVVVSGNELSFSGTNASATNWFAGIYVFNSINVVVENCLVHDNSAYGIDISTDTPATYERITVKNNYVYQNGNGGIGIAFNKATISGNHIYKNGKRSDAVIDTHSNYNPSAIVGNNAVDCVITNNLTWEDSQNIQVYFIKKWGGSPTPTYSFSKSIIKGNRVIRVADIAHFFDGDNGDNDVDDNPITDSSNTLVAQATAGYVKMIAANGLPSYAAPFTLTTTGTSGAALYSGGTLNIPNYGAAAGGSVFSALTAAAATNTIDNTQYKQEWQWNTLAGTDGLKLSSTSTAAASNTQVLMNIALSGTNSTSAQTTYGLKVSNTHGGTTSTNVAVYVSATGGASANWGLQADAPGIASTVTGGIQLLNSTASTSGATVQMAPTLSFLSHAWKSNATAVDQTHEYYFQNLTATGAAQITSVFSLQFKRNGAAATTVFSVSDLGVWNFPVVSGNPTFQFGNGYTAMAGNSTTTAYGLTIGPAGTTGWLQLTGNYSTASTAMIGISNNPTLNVSNPGNASPSYGIKSIPATNSSVNYTTVPTDFIGVSGNPQYATGASSVVFPKVTGVEGAVTLATAINVNTTLARGFHAFITGAATPTGKAVTWVGLDIDSADVNHYTTAAYAIRAQGSNYISRIEGKLSIGSTTDASSTFFLLPGSTTAASTLNIPTGSAPTSPVDGDVWREDNTNTGLKIRINGVTKTVTVS